MKTTLIAALFAIAGLTACEKTTVNPPATTVVTPTVEVPTAAPAPVVVQGAPGAPGAAGEAGAAGAAGTPGAAGAEGEKGEPGKTGDTVIVMPEKTN